MSVVDRELRKGHLPDLTRAQEECLTSAAHCTQTIEGEDPETFFEVRAGLDQSFNRRTLTALGDKGLVEKVQTYGRLLHIARLTNEGQRVRDLLLGI